MAGQRDCPVRIDCRPERQKLGDRLGRHGVIENFQHDPSGGEVNGPSDDGGRQQHNQQQLDENVMEIPSFQLLQWVKIVVERLDDSFAEGVERVLAGRAFQFDPGPLDETFQTENVTASGPRFLDVRAEANGALAVVVIESSWTVDHHQSDDIFSIVLHIFGWEEKSQDVRHSAHEYNTECGPVDPNCRLPRQRNHSAKEDS